jgi:transposase
MPTPKPPYPAEFRRQMVELVQAGRKPTQLAREFNVTAQSISTWVAQAAVDSGKPARNKDVLSSAEREELARLRRENKRLQQERDILAKATAWFAGRGDKTSIGSSNS